MNKHESVLFGIVEGLVEEKTSLSVKEMESLNENEVLLYVYASQKDISRLIGKKGSTATAIRHLVLVAFAEEKKRFTVRFESF